MVFAYVASRVGGSVTNSVDRRKSAPVIAMDGSFLRRVTILNANGFGSVKRVVDFVVIVSIELKYRILTEDRSEMGSDTVSVSVANFAGSCGKRSVKRFGYGRLVESVVIPVG